MGALKSKGSEGKTLETPLVPAAGVGHRFRGAGEGAAYGAGKEYNISALLRPLAQRNVGSSLLSGSRLLDRLGAADDVSPCAG